jgi:hypothetical protein
MYVLKKIKYVKYRGNFFGGWGGDGESITKRSETMWLHLIKERSAQIDTLSIISAASIDFIDCQYRQRRHHRRSQPLAEIRSKHFFTFLHRFQQGCQIFLGTTYQEGVKMYQITTKYTKFFVCQIICYNIPKRDQMATKYTK